MDLSLKPPKKSDLSKTWMRKKPDRKIKIHPEYHLIVTEGEVTEPSYFRAIKGAINRKYAEKVHLDISGEGENNIRLLEKAKYLANKSPNIYKHVWIIYDTDDFSDESVDIMEKLCAESSSEETIFHDIWSNQCIELWFLLHFSYMQSDIHRSEYWPKLTKCLKEIGATDYRKNREDMYEILYPYMDNAINNAKRLEIVNKGKKPSQSSPGTRMHELIELLRPYL